MHVLVTRPIDDAQDLAAALAARGHEALIAPMLTIAPARGVEPPLDLAGVQALLFTSANGARVFAGLSESRDLPVFAVGDASAGAARDAGFARVESAGGDVADLTRLVAGRLDPKKGALFHAAASKVAGDLKGLLEAEGFSVRRDVLYDATAASELTKELRSALSAGSLDIATFFSPRSAETFVSLAQDAGLDGACTRTVALALSDAVAEKLRALSWAGVEVAAGPNQDSLLACLDGIAAGAVHGRNHDDGTANR